MQRNCLKNCQSPYQQCIAELAHFYYVQTSLPPTSYICILLINPRHTYAVRVTVVAVSVCLLSHISPPGLLFVVKPLPRTQQATKVKKFVVFSLKLLRCRNRAFPPLNSHTYGWPFFLRITRMCIVHTQVIQGS